MRGFALPSLAAVLLLGCGASEPPGTAEVALDAPAATGVGQPVMQAVMASATALPTAGVLLMVQDDVPVLSGASIDFPPRAVDEPTVVSLGLPSLPTEPLAPPPLSPAVAVMPEGLRLLIPAVLTLPLPPGWSSSGARIARWDATAWTPLPGQVSGDFVSAEVDRSGMYGVIEGSRVHVEVRLPASFAEGGTVTWVAGPAPLPGVPGAVIPTVAPPDVQTAYVSSEEPLRLSLPPGRYRLRVEPEPAPSEGIDLFFTVSPATKAAAETVQVLTLTHGGAYGTAGVGGPPGLSARVQGAADGPPAVRCDAAAPPGTPITDAETGGPPDEATRYVAVGPVSVQEVREGAVRLMALAADPAGQPIRHIWSQDEPEQGKIDKNGLSSLVFRPQSVRDGVYFAQVAAYDPDGLFDRCLWRITTSCNGRPSVRVVHASATADFGRRDGRRRPTLLPASDPLLTAHLAGLGLCAFGYDERPLLHQLPSAPLDHMDPAQHPDGATCIYAVVEDPNGDPLEGGFEPLGPAFERGTYYAALAVPGADSGSAVLLPDGRSVATLFPSGLAPGAVLDTAEKLAAYNVTLMDLANRGLLPLTPPLQPGPSGAQALPVVWEAPDDPDPDETTHDCAGHIGPPDCAWPLGGATRVTARVSDGETRARRDFATVAYPTVEAVFPGGHMVERLSPIPADPLPYTSVAIEACVAPKNADVPVRFTVAGTDGYVDTFGPRTDAKGCTVFHLPGAGEGVVDVVTARVGSASATIAYTY